MGVVDVLGSAQLRSGGMSVVRHPSFPERSGESDKPHLRHVPRGLPREEYTPSARERSDRTIEVAGFAQLKSRQGEPRANAEAVVIGCSTGGPEALMVLLGDVEQPLSVPVFIVQHMPERFTKELARRLDARVSSKVVEAEDNMAPEPGVCYVAHGSHHLKLRRHYSGTVTMILDDGPKINSFKPSVEPLFESAAEVYGRGAVAVMLTGMGRDGAEAAARLADHGCPVVVQDRQSSVVWGMPGAVVEEELATEILPLNKIGARLTHLDQVGWKPFGSKHRSYLTSEVLGSS